MKIIELHAENVKRLKAIHITPDPDGSMVVISGENEAGKSSVLDSIMMALGGTSAVPDEPIRRGARKGSIRVDLGQLVVERTFSPKGSKLTVTSAGVPQKSPQTILNELVNTLSFDPMEFATVKPAKQATILRELLGLDFSELDAKRAAIYAQRTETNREVKRLQASVDAVGHLDSPSTIVVPERVDVVGVVKQIEERQEEAREYDRQVDRANLLETDLVVMEEEEQALLAKLDDLRSRRSERKAELAAIEVECTSEKRHAIGAALHLLKLDLEAAQSRNDQAAEAERKIAALEARAEEAQKLAGELRKAEELAASQTDQIEAIDEQKQRQLAEAEFPIDGLGLDDGGVTMDGLPFEQACTSKRIRASIAIGAKLNPKLKVMLVRQGNDLGRTMLRDVAELAAEMGLQVWCERIEPGGMAAVVIEDGEVVE